MDHDGQVHCSLVKAKSLLARSEKHTITRLELEAALDAVKLAKFVPTELELHSCPCIYWTDSTIVLQSLRAESKKFSVFSRNRLAQIQRYTCVYNCCHVPSALNPADLTSRGCTADVLASDKAWFCGLDFLKKLASDWPQQFHAKFTDDNFYKVYNLEKKGSVSMPIDVITPGLPSACDKLIAHFSSFYRLKVATAWLLRSKAYLLNRVRGLESCVNFGSPIISDELEVAAAELVKYMQRRSFSE